MQERKKHRLNRRGKTLFGALLAVLVLILTGTVLLLVSRYGSGRTEIRLNGEEKTVLGYGKEQYVERGATAVFHGKLFSSNIQLPVEIKNQPGADAKPGVYQVVYTASYHGEYTSEKIRTVTIRDVTPPELVLLGESSLDLEAGEAYEEAGFRATDDCDGDLSALVTVSGTVDSGTPGTYSISYKISDKAGNTMALSRQVTVKGQTAPAEPTEEEPATEPAPTEPAPTEPTPTEPAPTELAPTEPAPPAPVVSGPVIFLTFDDGPGPLTENLLALLDKYGVKVTFFVTNQYPDYHYLIAKEAAAGHSVGIHSATHSKEIYASEEAFFHDIQIMQDIIVQQTGKETNILRFPFGSSNQTSSFNPGIMTRLTALVQQRGFAYFDWNVSSGDGSPDNSTEAVYNYVINGVSQHETSVVLMHDLNPNSMAAVEEIIKWGQANGYTFLPLTHDSPVCHHQVMN